MKDDTIKRSDAIKVVSIPCETCLARDSKDCEKCSVPKLNELINAIPSADRPQGEWILCSERMPEEREWIGTKKFGTTISDEVLVTFESRGERFVKPMHFQNGELGGMDKHTMDAIHGEWKVVAWKPLPEPWKGAGDE